MRYKLLGKSGLRVSELCLGTMTFGEEWGWGASKEESRRMFNAFTEAGGNFIDTANHYTKGTSESYVGEFIASSREQYVVATKYTLTDRPNDPNGGGNHRKSLVQSLEGSLKRLNTEYIDLYWVHAWDEFTPIEEVMRALDDQVRAGKILYVGISDTPAWVVTRGNTFAELCGWSPFIGIQVQYNILERTTEREILPMARALEIGATIWSPLKGGVLSGKYNEKRNEPMRYSIDHPMRASSLNERNLAITKTVMEVAQTIGRTPAQVALNWIRQKKEFGVLIPIIGGRNVTQIRENLGCLEFELNMEQMRILDEYSKIEPGFPNDFLNAEMAQHLIHGDTYHLIDCPRK